MLYNVAMKINDLGGVIESDGRDLRLPGSSWKMSVKWMNALDSITVLQYRSTVGAVLRDGRLSAEMTTTVIEAGVY